MTYDIYQLEYKARAEKLRDEVRAAGFPQTRVEKAPDDRCTFNVLLTHEGHEYRVIRDHKGIVSLTRADYPHYPNVSSYTRGETWKKHRASMNQVKVLTGKKIRALMEREEAYHADLTALDAAAADKGETFLAEIAALEERGVPVRWSADKRSGYIERGGMCYRFDVLADGYISRRIEMDYHGESSIEAFLQLSENKYIPKPTE